jgi:hypothetical protein
LRNDCPSYAELAVVSRHCTSYHKIAPFFLARANFIIAAEIEECHLPKKSIAMKE